MLECIIDLFEKYQTFVAGVIGFAGVIITIQMNAKLSREQHQREIEHDANTVRISLSIELALLCDSYKLRIAQLNDMQGRSALINEYIANQVYLQMLPKIGLLTKSEIEKVMTAHQLNNELPFRLGLYTDDLELLEKQGHIKVTADQAQVVVQLHEKFLKIIESALSALKENIK